MNRAPRPAPLGTYLIVGVLQLVAPIIGFPVLVFVMDPPLGFLSTFWNAVLYTREIWSKSGEVLLVAMVASGLALALLKDERIAFRLCLCLAVCNALFGGLFAIGRSM